MQNNIVNPLLENVICKVKQLEELTPEEDFIYLTHIEQIPTPEAYSLMKEFYPATELNFIQAYF